jgi:hypothetical protein
MIKFTQQVEKILKDRINVVFTLIGTLLFCVHEIVIEEQDEVSIILKIILVILLFWFILGRIASRILYSLLKEIIEDQTEIDEDMRRRVELQEFDKLEKAETKENVQKVKF